MDRTRLLYERMDRRYQEMLSWVLAHRKILIGSILLILCRILVAGSSHRHGIHSRDR